VNLVEPVRDGLLDMWAYKARTVLQTMGILLGSASVIVTMALLSGGKAEDRDFLEQTGGVTTLEVRKKTGGMQRMFARDMATFGLEIDDYDAVRNAVGSICEGDVCAKVAANRNLRIELAIGERHDEITMWAVTPDYLSLKKLSMDEGRFLADSDVDTAQSVIVLGSKIRATLFGTDNALGKYVTVRTLKRGQAPQPPALPGAPKSEGRPDRRYLVVGVLDEKVYKRSDDQNNWLEWMNDLAYVPITTALARETGGREIGGLQVAAPSLETVRPIKQALDDALVKRHRGVRNYQIFDRAERLAEWESRSMMYDAAIGGAGAISLLVGGIVVMNILLASLTQRIREVGIRKALGARNLEIFIQFLTESVIVAGMGGVGGALLGSALSGTVSRMLEQKLVLDAWVIGMGVGVSMSVGLVFGIYPAIRASILDPVVALRYE
jgi:putative ABC transport system permease protein